VSSVQFPNIIRSILLSFGTAHCKLVDTFLRHIRMSNGHRPSQRSRYRDYATVSTFRGSNSGRGRNFLSSPKRPYRLWYPLSIPLNGYWCSFPGLKRSGRDVDHSAPSSADVKNEWTFTSPPLHAFMVWTGATLPAPFLVLAMRSFL